MVSTAGACSRVGFDVKRRADGFYIDGIGIGDSRSDGDGAVADGAAADGAVADAVAADARAGDGTAPAPIVIHKAASATLIGSQPAVTLPFTVPAVPDRMLLVGAGCDMVASVPSAEVAGTAMTRAVERIGSYGSSALFYSINPPAGASDIVVTFPGGSGLRGVVAVVLEGVEAAPPEQTSHNWTKTNSITTTHSVVTKGAVVVDLLVGVFTSPTIVTGLPSAANAKQQVLRIVDFGSGFTPGAMSAVVDSPVGSVQLGWSYTTTSVAELMHVVVTIAPTSGP